MIEVCGKGGSNILSSGEVEVDTVKLDKLRAMVEAAREYGVY